MRGLLKCLAIALGLWILLDITAYASAEILWFQELKYLVALRVRFQTQATLWLVVGSLSALALLGNLGLARRLRHPQPPESIARAQRGRSRPDPRLSLRAAIAAQRQPTSAAGPPPPPTPWTLPLRPLLILVLSLSILLAYLALHYGRTAAAYWQPDLSVPKVTPPLPQAFNLATLAHLWQGTSPHLGLQALAIALLSLGILLLSELLLTAIAVALSLICAFCLAGNWTRFLEAWQASTFDHADPLFGLDVSFYIFRLPLGELLAFWWGGIALYSLLAVALIYLLSGDSISQGKFPGFSHPQRRHLQVLGSLWAMTLCLRHAIACFSLVYSPRGVVYGASYTDIHVQLPLEIALSIAAGVIATSLVVCALSGRSPTAQFLARRLRRPIAPLWLLLSGVYPALFLTQFAGSNLTQNLIVRPNELESEQPYIEYSIAETRAAFTLDRIDAQTFNPSGQLTPSILAQNEPTIENIRLWDTRPLLEANRQLQEIRLYYRFLDADIDRYTLQLRARESSSPFNGRKQQVLIALRELDYDKVPADAKTWVNKHLVYTHGYGFTLSPVNEASTGGLPAYFVRDIGTEAEEGALRISERVAPGSIPIGQPRIYYGELADAYVMTSTRIKELDFPSGQDNVLNVYDGRGGISISALWRRLAFAEYLRDWKMLFTRNFTPETKLLMRRNINQRVRAIAPFLRYDADPYIVNVATGGALGDKTGNHLYWLLDAYTTSDRYPYSDPGDHTFNYIRNSVKVVIDAYDGDVYFYVADPSDPLIQTWQKILPGFFQPLEAMPASLRAHIRYPTDFFSVQSERLLTYHMTDPRSFYNREDQWQVPQEIYADEPRPVEPYHVIIRLPGETSEEFILLHPYTPVARPNLIAWLAARSDGDRYGTLLLYQFPKQTLVFGITQIEALINQDPLISQQISLWNSQGSRVLQGNLLVIPIEDSLLYVEPLYIEAANNSLPTLARVIVFYNNTIVMAPTLTQAFEGLFSEEPPASTAPSLIRPVEELSEDLLEGLVP